MINPSIVKLANWLRQIQSQHGITWIPKPPSPKGESDAAIARREATDLAQELLLTLPAEPELRLLQELLAHLLEFHDRERKATAWVMFDRHEMTEDQLIDDIDCLGRLTRTKRQKEQIKRSFYYEYQFDPRQETKISEGSTCFFAHDLSMSCIIQALDRNTGIVTIKDGS